MLDALSPLDGRYANALAALRPFFSEEALIRARVEVEVRYFIALAKESGVKELPKLSAKQEQELERLVADFDRSDAMRVKQIEQTTNHDVKAVEYFLKEKLKRISGLEKYLEFIHFALTSEDVNNLAYGLMIHGALKKVIIPSLTQLQRDLSKIAAAHAKVTMLSLTHGQPATPTTVGKEFAVFDDRLERQLLQLKAFRMHGKLGGAVGNFSAHRAAYPDVKWEKFRTAFLKHLSLIPLEHTTQINPHDDVAELSHLLFRIDTILLGLSRDAWMYISRGIFKQRVVRGEVGSSTMPHKVNPIDFENAEGNFGLANALFHHFAEKLPISRLQRDLSDSTVQRSIGTAFGYHLIAVTALRRGLGKLSLDHKAVEAELDRHPEVFAEAIQTVLRKHGVQGAYEKLKALTRGEKITKQSMIAFVETLSLPADSRKRLKDIIE